MAPIAAAVTGVALSGPMPGPAVWIGVLTVGAGLAIGLSTPALSGPPGPGGPPVITGKVT